MTPEDPRMKGFRRRVEVSEVNALLAERVGPLPPETAETVHAAGRVLAESVAAPCDVPPFDRSAMDGYAVQAA